jgi:SAM-dependent methyltransferase
MAEVYDRWMEGVDYNTWWTYLRDTFALSPGMRILETACGTGNLTARIASEGYQVVASDFSAAMLAQAEQKLRGRRNVRFLQLDMRQLPTNLGKFDAIIAACDAVNYLTRPEHVQQFIYGAASLLQDGGVLLFDVHGMGRVTDWAHAPHHNFVSSDSCYLWRAELRGKAICHHITGFTRNPDGTWQRFDELHQQRYYNITDIQPMIEAAGLHMEAAYQFRTHEPYSELSSRVQVCARLVR